MNVTTSLLPFIPTPNQVIKDGDAFYVSFNGGTSVYGDQTTALVWGQMERFYILTGDHQAAYAALIPQGWVACLGYYESNIALSHKHSDRLPHSVAS